MNENVNHISSSSAASAPPRLRGLWRFLRPWLLPDYLFNRRVRITRRGLVFVGLILAIGLAAVNTGNNLLYVVLGMMLASLLLSFTLSEWAVARIQVMRSQPPTVTAGVSFRVVYSLVNPNRRAPSLALRLTERLGSAEVMAAAPYLSAGETVEAKAAALAQERGRIQFRDLTLMTSGPFGWFTKARRLTQPGEIVVLPQGELAALDRENLLALGEERPQNRRGRGDELFGFRDYFRGDPLKDIHWKTSARTGRLLIRLREKEEEKKLRLTLELSATRPVETDPRREALVRQAAGLIEAAIAEGWQVRLEAAGRGIDFGAGPAHLYHLLLFLALFDDPQTPAGSPLPPTESPAVRLG